MQRKCIEFALKAKPARRYIPKKQWQYKVWWFVTSRPFELGIFVLIILNTLVLALKYDGQPETYDRVLDIANFVFTCIFTAEFVLKIIAFKVSSALPSELCTVQ